MAKSLKLDIFHEKLFEILNEKYPDYKIDQYLNGFGSISWLSVVEYPANLKIAEVIVVERFGPGDSPCDSLLVIDYVNSDSRRYDDADNALFYMKSILCTASDRKKARAADLAIEATDLNKNENQVNPNLKKTASYETYEINTIGDINKAYLITGRCNGKTLFYQNLIKNLFGFKIKDVLFNDPATVVLWEDGEKTVVQCQNGEEFDPEKGLAMAITKRLYGNKYSYYDVFKKFIGRYKKKKFREALDKAMEITPDEIIRDGHRYVLADNEQESVPDENPREETVVANLTVSDVSLSPEDATAVLKPYCDKQTEKPEDNGNVNE